MTTEFTRELEDLAEAKQALQGQAQAMLELLAQFETRLQARLDAAEARINELQAKDAQMRRLQISGPVGNHLNGQANGQHHGEQVIQPQQATASR